MQPTISHGRIPSAKFAAPLFAAACALLPLSMASAQAPIAGASNIPVIVNVYPNAGIGNAQIDTAIAEANKLLNKACVNLVRVRPPRTIVAGDGGANQWGGDNGDGGGTAGDGSFTGEERNNLRDFGQDEVDQLPCKKGIKLSFGQTPVEGSNALGVALKQNGDCKTGEPTIILKRSATLADTGKTIAHEVGHVLGIDGDYDNASKIMDCKGRGDDWCPSERRILKKPSLKYKFGKCSRQFSRAFPAERDENQSGRGRDARDATAPTGRDLREMRLESATGLSAIDVEFTVTDPLPPTGPLDLVYRVGFDADADSATGVPLGALAGVDRVVEIFGQRDPLSGDLVVDGFVVDVTTGQVDVLPCPPVISTLRETWPFAQTGLPIGTAITMSLPKAGLGLVAPVVPVVTTAGDSFGGVDDVLVAAFDRFAWLHDATLATFGTGVPVPGQPYPVAIEGLTPSAPFELRLDGQPVLLGTLDGAGSFAGSFPFPPTLPVDRLHYLTATDGTGRLAANNTCPEALPGTIPVATTSPFGLGCALPGSTLPPLELVPPLPPIPGQPFGFEMFGVPTPALVGSVLLGTTPLDLPLDVLGFPGCSLLGNGDVATLPALLDGLGGGTANLGLIPPSGVGLTLHAQAVVVAPGLPAGTLGLVTSNGVSFTVGADVSSIPDPALEPGLVVHLEGSDTFTAGRPTPFFNVYNNSSEQILAVAFDLAPPGLPLLPAQPVFEVGGLPVSVGSFEAGNSQLVDPACPQNTFLGTDAATGLVYPATEFSPCPGPFGPKAHTGWQRISGIDGAPTGLLFEFENFGPGDRFGFECVVTDGGGISLGAVDLHRMVVTVVTDQRIVQGDLALVDGDTAIQTF